MAAIFPKNKEDCMEPIPRKEYPRPQFEREEWINLNGEWSCEFDFGNSGIEQEWNKSKGFSRKIIVPFCPESRLSGIGWKDFIPAMFYHRTLEIPEKWDGKRILIHFGAVDYECEGFINGESVGTHVGGTVSFEFDLTKFVSAGKTYDFVLRVRDDLRSGLQPHGKQSPRLHSYGCLYTRTTGIWQTVWLEAVAKQGLKSCHILPLLDSGAFRFDPEFYQEDTDCTLKIRVFSETMSVEAECPAETGATLTLKLPQIRPWSPEDPFLYDVEYTLQNRKGEILDRVRGYAGLRKIHIEHGQVYLNNKVLFQRLVLDQGFYEDGIWTAPSDEALRRDIELSMKAGFNGARLHQKVFEERFHYWADKLGYLTWGESSSWGCACFSSIPPAAELFWNSGFNFLQEWKEIVKRDRNHPSIITWTPANESCTSNSYNHRYRQFIAALYDTTKELDPTRPVNDCSGYTHVKTDLWTVHDYMYDGKILRNSLMPPEGKVKVCQPEQSVPYSGQPYNIDEYGGVRYIPEGRTPWQRNSWGYNKQEIRSPEEFCAKLRELTDAILSVPGMTGYCYTQLTDVEQEQNGVYNYDRTPKVPVESLYAIFSRNPEN